MIGESKLDNASIIECLKKSYGLTVSAIELLAMGYDSRAAVYRIEADDQAYFLKVRYDAVDALSIQIPRYLKTHDLPEAVAPLPTLTGDLWSTVETFTLLLYPFITGRSGWGADLSDDQWRTFGGILKRLHTTVLPDDLLNQLPKEDYRLHPVWSALTKRIHHMVQAQRFENPAEQDLAAVWLEHYSTIGMAIERAEELSVLLPTRGLPLVLCHADIHPNNVLIDDQGDLHVVDWDQPILSPAERDLLFFTTRSFSVSERAEELFLEGYGNVQIDPTTMAFYAYSRLVEDLGSFGEQVFFLDVSNYVKQDAADWFKKIVLSSDLLESANRFLSEA